MEVVSGIAFKYCCGQDTEITKIKKHGFKLFHAVEVFIK